jgi:ATP-binding cassette, subfamily A (ABC1), member 3
LDEADLLGDHIAILAAPGKLVAQGTPVSLKTALGEGYIIQVIFETASSAEKSAATPPFAAVQDRLRTVAPETYYSLISPVQGAFHIKSKDPRIVQAALQLLKDEAQTFNIASYDVHGTSIEDIFLGLMAANDKTLPSDEKKADPGTSQTSSLPSLSPEAAAMPAALELTTGRPRSPYSQAFTIFHKRLIIARRSWLTPLLAVLIAICGACIPIFFISNRSHTCVRTFLSSEVLPLYFPVSPLTLIDSGPGSDILIAPLGAATDLGITGATLNISDVSDNTTFVNDVEQNFRNLSLGGVSMNLQSYESLVAWEASPPGYTGPTMLNLATNILYNRALNQSGSAVGSSIINANFQFFPPVNAGTLVALKWVAFFGAAMVRIYVVGPCISY